MRARGIDPHVQFLVPGLRPVAGRTARQTGTDHLGVLMIAADAARWAGLPGRGLALVEAALAEADEAGDDERRASLLLRRAGLRRELLLPGQIEDLQAALRLVKAPALARAQVLAQLC